jgi:hypothetical protein
VPDDPTSNERDYVRPPGIRRFFVELMRTPWFPRRPLYMDGFSFPENEARRYLSACQIPHDENAVYQDLAAPRG